MNSTPVSSHCSPTRPVRLRQITGKRAGVRKAKADTIPHRGEGMEFGILFTLTPTLLEAYPHREVHARVTAEIQAADRLGYDTAWVAEHHFSNQYGIMPDVFTYLGYLAAKTSRIRLGTAVVTVPLYEPVRVVENLAFVDICRADASCSAWGRVIGPTSSPASGGISGPATTGRKRRLPSSWAPAHAAHHASGAVLPRRLRGSMKCSQSVSSSPTRRSSWLLARTARWRMRRATASA